MSILPFIRHGHGNTVAVIKAHRHFDIGPSEAMLEQQPMDPDAEGDVVSVTKPVPLAEIERLGATPNMIAFGATAHQWFPVNFGKIIKTFGKNNKDF
jgi:hypothetical protein